MSDACLVERYPAEYLITPGTIDETFFTPEFVSRIVNAESKLTNIENVMSTDSETLAVMNQLIQSFKAADTALDGELRALIRSATEALEAEVTRATGAETSLQTALNSFKGEFDSKIATEKSRAESAEDQLGRAITSEKQALMQAVADENARAVAAEAVLLGKATSTQILREPDLVQQVLGAPINGSDNVYRLDYPPRPNSAILYVGDRVARPESYVVSADTITLSCKPVTSDVVLYVEYMKTTPVAA